MSRFLPMLVVLCALAPMASASPATVSIVPPSLFVAQGNVPSLAGGDAPAAGPAEGAAAGQAGPAQEPPGMGQTLIVMGLIFLFFWLFFIRPQNKQVREHEELVKTLKKGDDIITQGGLLGRIVGFDDTTGSVLVEIAKDTRVRVVRNQIARHQKSGEDQSKAQ